MAGFAAPTRKLPDVTPQKPIQGQQIGASVPQLTPGGTWQQTQWSLNTPPTQTPVPEGGGYGAGPSPYAPGPSSTATASAGPGATMQAPAPLDQNSILNILKGLKGEATPDAPARVGAPSPVAQAPSQSLAFARYKDQSGAIGNAALRALKDQMTERGLGDSGIEAQLSGNILGQVARGQGDAAFQQQLAAEQQGWQAKQQGYQGDISQRGQDIGLQEAGINNMTALAPTVLRLLSSARY